MRIAKSTLCKSFLVIEGRTCYRECLILSTFIRFMCIFLSLLVSISCAIPFIRWILDKRRPTVISFFHPHAASRGGGERVLWSAIGGILSDPRFEDATLVVYSIHVDRSDVLRKVYETFGLPRFKHPERIVFLPVYFPILLEARTWPVATLLGQSVGAAMSFIASLLMTPLPLWPSVFVDTTGCPFTLPVVKCLAWAKVVAYIHYPTMSADMFAKVRLREPQFNHRKIFAASWLLSHLKLGYYIGFLFLYRLCSLFTNRVICNSEWTACRVRQVWKRNDVRVMYPPAVFQPQSDSHSLDNANRECLIVSLAQFRPEKNHEQQIRVFSNVLKQIPEARLSMIGGARNAADLALVDGLRQLANSLEIRPDRIELLVNADRRIVEKYLRKAKCAIHTMRDEHFGISLLEFMEAQVPVVCHRSGGPESDILFPDESYGFLATSDEEFTSKIVHVLRNFEGPKLTEKRRAASKSLDRFLNDVQFGKAFCNVIAQVV